MYKHHVLLLKGVMRVPEWKWQGDLRGYQLDAVEIAHVRDGNTEQGLGSEWGVSLKVELMGFAGILM